MKEYIGADTIAAELGVTRAAVSNWQRREIPGIPACAAIVKHPRSHDQHLWLRSSLPEWKEWYAGWKLNTAEHQLAAAEANLAKARARLAAMKGNVQHG